MTSKILTLSAAAALALAIPGPAQAQQNPWFGDHGRYDSGQYQYERDAERVARDNGYREGLKHGEDAARRGKPFDLAREKDYRSGTEGYNRRYGSKDEYREEFRNGFAQGYREAYDRAGYRLRGEGYDRGEGYGYDRPLPQGTTGRVYGGVYARGGSIAFQNGENDGYRKGLDDARHGRYPDVRRQKWYRDGDHGYNDDRDGSKDAYRAQYRQGFEDGYRRAFGDR